MFTANGASKHILPVSMGHFEFGRASGGQNVITSISAGSSGTLSVSATFTAELKTTSTEGLPSGEVAVNVLSVGLLCCIMGALCFVCHRNGNEQGIMIDKMERGEEENGNL